MVRAFQSRINDLAFVAEQDVLDDALDVAADAGPNLSDAFLLLSLPAGYFSSLIESSTTLLVTAAEAWRLLLAR